MKVKEDEALESGIYTIEEHLQWNEQFWKSIIKELKGKEKIYVER